MTVTGIEELSRSRCKIYLNDSFAFVLYKGELRLYGVKLQEELTEENYRQITGELLPRRAALRCMNLLKARAYTESQLRRKLSEAFYPADSIEYALEYVKSYHYVDDARYARDYIESSSGRKSRRVIEMELARRGVPRELVEEAFAEQEEAGRAPDEEALAAMWLEKKHYDPRTADPSEKRRMAAFLYRRGIGPSAIRRAMEE
ncbi:MAG: regulatory protein RecX [Eubacteriales bacterium]|nr:regulatory protein RecX [Eubacteriales bacterium]